MKLCRAVGLIMLAMTAVVVPAHAVNGVRAGAFAFGIQVDSVPTVITAVLTGDDGTTSGSDASASTTLLDPPRICTAPPDQSSSGAAAEHTQNGVSLRGGYTEVACNGGISHAVTNAALVTSDGVQVLGVWTASAAGSTLVRNGGNAGASAFVRIERATIALPVGVAIVLEGLFADSSSASDGQTVIASRKCSIARLLLAGEEVTPAQCDPSSDLDLHPALPIVIRFGAQHPIEGGVMFNAFELDMDGQSDPLVALGTVYTSAELS